MVGDLVDLLLQGGQVWLPQPTKNTQINGLVGRKSINTKPLLKINQGFHISCNLQNRCDFFAFFRQEEASVRRV